MSAMFVKLVLILCVSDCFGLLIREKLDTEHQYQQGQDLVTFVNQKIEGMERLLAEKDERVDRLESIITNQKTETSQLKRGMRSLEEEILNKDGIVNRLVNRVTDLERMMDSIPQELVSRHIIRLNPNSNALPKDVLDQSSINETTSLRQSGRSPLPGNEIRESSRRWSKRPHSSSRNENLTDSVVSQTDIEAEDGSIYTFPRIQQKRVAPPSQTPNQHVAFHVALSMRKAYREDNTVVYDNVKLDHGNGYNPADGIYTAPESGTYVFTWTSLCDGHQRFQTVLVVNEAYMGSSWTDAFTVDEYHQSTAVVIITLSQGDHVSIRMGSNYGHGTFISQTNVGESTFSGWKLD